MPNTMFPAIVKQPPALKKAKDHIRLPLPLDKTRTVARDLTLRMGDKEVFVGVFWEGKGRERGFARSSVEAWKSRGKCKRKGVAALGLSPFAGE